MCHCRDDTSHISTTVTISETAHQVRKQPRTYWKLSPTALVWSAAMPVKLHRAPSPHAADAHHQRAATAQRPPDRTGAGRGPRARPRRRTPSCRAAAARPARRARPGASQMHACAPARPALPAARRPAGTARPACDGRRSEASRSAMAANRMPVCPASPKQDALREQPRLQACKPLRSALQQCTAGLLKY